tara:strand:- start:457 stop:693 length:237 start_codon:yes stop_codon:yes gene_type:complete
MKEIISINIDHNNLEGPGFLKSKIIINIRIKKVLMALLFLIDKKVGLKIVEMGINKIVFMINNSKNKKSLIGVEGCQW